MFYEFLEERLAKELTNTCYGVFPLLQLLKDKQAKH